MTSFRYPAPLAIVAVVTLLGSMSLAALGGAFLAVPLVPLAVTIWAWRAGTDVNERGIRIRALFGNRVIFWDSIAALVPDRRGRAVAALTDGTTVALTAVKATDLPRVMEASGKSNAAL